jgi:cold shock CspA family protein
MLTGRVTDFDDAAGLGTVIADDGTAFAFHCIELVDGTRTVAPGQPVVFRALPRFGRIQAGTIRKL